MGKFVGDAMQESAREALRDHGDRNYQKGFTSAAAISLRRIQEKLDALKSRMKSPGLSQTEQAAYVQLEELKSEIEADCDRFWRGTDVNWRPRKPVAKAVARRPEN
jgi:hypothetical protein